MTTMRYAIEELNQYRDMPKLPMKDDPIQWWEEHTHNDPILYRLAMKKLSIPATLTPFEREWIIASHIITKDRTRLDSHFVSNLIFLRENGEIKKSIIVQLKEETGSYTR